MLIVSDGVSASPNPHLASAAAVAAVAERLAGRPFAGAGDLAEAVAAAQEAATAIPADGDPNWPEDGTHPACTLVVAVVAADDVHVANVGDARGYLLRPDAGAAGRLDRPPSVIHRRQRGRRGRGDGHRSRPALERPAGHAITAWLGADAPVVEPHLGDPRARRRRPRPGVQRRPVELRHHRRRRSAASRRPMLPAAGREPGRRGRGLRGAGRLGHRPRRHRQHRPIARVGH